MIIRRINRTKTLLCNMRDMKLHINFHIHAQTKQKCFYGQIFFCFFSQFPSFPLSAADIITDIIYLYVIYVSLYIIIYFSCSIHLKGDRWRNKKQIWIYDICVSIFFYFCKQEFPLVQILITIIGTGYFVFPFLKQMLYAIVGIFRILKTFLQ